MKKHKALYFFIGKSSFTEKDTLILEDFFQLKTFNFEFGNKWKVPFQLIYQFAFLVWNIGSVKICFIQLSGFHSLLPTIFCKLFGKKSVIIAAGTDCHSFPSIGYGNYQRPLLSWATKISFKHCTLILPKHKSLWHTKYTYDHHDFPEQGISYFNKGIETPYECIENGYDGRRFKKSGECIPNSFITIAGLLNRESQQKLKGIDLIIEAAGHFPDYTFTIVGAENSYFKDLPSNIKLIPKTANDKLPAVLSAHKYYLQLSMAEGFPNALCEAMLCECIPIGSNVFSIPEIIGDTGYILDHRNSDELKTLLSNLSETDQKKNGQSARQRILQNYPLEKRKEKLKAVIEKLVVT